MDTCFLEDSIDCQRCALRSPMFSYLTPEEVTMMNENKVHIVFKKGETIRKQGAQLSHVMSVTSGYAKLYREGAKNISTIMRVVRPTDFIGGPAIFLDKVHHFTVSALTETHVCFISINVFKEILDRNKKFEVAFLYDYSRNVISVYTRLIDLANKQVPGSMADTLLYLSDSVFKSTAFSMFLSKQDLADLSSMSKYSASKILSIFEKDGIISMRNDLLTLRNPELLRKISQNG